MRTVFITTVLLAAIAFPVVALGSQGSVGVGAGATAPIRKLNDELDPSYVINGFGLWQIRGVWHVRASGAYDRFRPNKEDREACEAVGRDCKSRIGRVDGGIEIARPGERGAQPYGFVELGAYNFKNEAEAAKSTTNLGGGFGGGFRVGGRRMGVGGELPVRWWREKESGERETYWYLEPNAFVYWRFGR